MKESIREREEMRESIMTLPITGEYDSGRLSELEKQLTQMQHTLATLVMVEKFFTVGFVECSLIFSGLAANRLWAHSPRAMANPKAELKTEQGGNSRQQSGAVTATGGVMQLSAAAPVLSAGSDFAAWRRKAKGVLTLGGCWDAVEGRDSDPATCSRAYAWLLCQCNDHYGSIVEQGKTAAGAWKALLAVNAKQSYGQRQQLWRQFVSFRMEAGETITQLYCRLADLCTELNDAGNEIPEQQQIGCLLEALPHTVPFQIAKQALTSLLLNTPPSLAAVQQYLLGVEGEAEAVQPAQLAAMHVPRKPMGVGGAGSSGSSSKQPAAKPAATPAPDDARHANVTSFRCGKKSHIARNCREPGAKGGGAGKRAGDGGASGSGGASGAGGAASAPAGLHAASLMAMQVEHAHAPCGASHEPSSGGSQVGVGGDARACCVAHQLVLLAPRAPSPCKPSPSLAAAAAPPGAPIAAGDSLVSSRRLWLADSGASHHITPERALLHDFRPVNQPVQIVLGKSTVRLVAYGLGSVHLNSDSGQPFTLRDVLWAPDATANYMSTVVADLAGWRVVQEGGGIRLEDRASPPTIVSGKLVGRSYQLWCTAELAVVGCEPPASLQAATAETPQLLHERLGHLSYRAMAEMVGKGMVEGVGVSAAQCKAAGSGVCPGCQAGKAHRHVADTLPSLAPPVKGVLDLVHTDVCGPFRVPSVSGLRYLLTFLDDFSRLSVVVCLKAKSDVPEAIKATVQWLETQTGRKLKALRSDRGTEFVNREGRNATPWELFFGEKPNLAALRVFGARAYAHVPEHMRSKLGFKAVQGVMVGYEPGSKAYRVLVPGGKILITKDVVFDELSQNVPSAEPAGVLEVVEEGAAGLPLESDPLVSLTSVPLPGPVPAPAPAHVPVLAREAEAAAAPGPGFMLAGTVGAGGGDGAAASAGGDGGGASAAEVSSLRRSARLSQQQPEYGSLAAAVAEAPAASVWVPRTIQEARASPLAEQWAMATDAEMESLLSYGTWELVPSPPGCRPLANRWVFSVKEDSKGNKRFKARLVVKGYLQREGVDFTELHAPVSKHATIYMQQPAGYEDGTARVCRLRRALYGLRQAPRAWHARLKAELEQLGFVASEADSCLFTMVRGNSKVLLAVYVDDCLLAVSKGDTATVAWVKEQLAAVFNIHQLGSAERFLGMEISRDRAAVLSQERYATSVVDRFGLADSKPRSVPLSTSEQLVREGEVQPHMGGHSYAELVGSLMHLAVCTRPDIAQAVGVCAKYMAAPTAQHWHALRGVLRYVADSRAEGLVFGAAEGLVGFCDADFAGDTDTRRSTTGYVFMLHGGAVSWSSRRQPTVAVSTTEAEYMAASAASKEALWLRTLVAELAVGSDVVQPVTIMCDNEAAITLIKHPIASAQSKHIDVLHHFVRERAARGEVVFKFCESEANVADGMTKALPRAKFEFGFVLVWGLSDCLSGSVEDKLCLRHVSQSLIAFTVCL
ncbi:hypothetical protein QJQ45_006125 [Haematococcus lacustris]|nr:hypothetical protein QJQ45_006125 [Haematococcus lacustris]